MITQFEFSYIGIEIEYSSEEIKDMARLLAIWALNQNMSSQIIRLNNIAYIDKIDGQMILAWDDIANKKWYPKSKKPNYFQQLQQEFDRVVRLKAFA